MTAPSATGTPLDRYPAPPCAATLGWTFEAVDLAAGWLRVRFDGRPEFRNPAGFIQGGFLAAMLDDTMGPLVVMATEGTLYPTTISLSVQYLAPARPGPLTAGARIVQLGKTIGYLEGELRGTDGPVARATSAVRLVPADRAIAPS